VKHLGKIITSLTLAFAFTPALAADGIKGSAIASRTVPADVVSVAFQIAEPAPKPGQEKNTNELSVLVRGFEVKGIKVLEASEWRLNNAAVDPLAPASSRTKLTKRLSLTLAGFKRIEDIADILDENGMSQNVTYTFDSTKFDAIRGDLQREAITKAVAQAQGWARDAGVKTGSVIDLSVSPVGGYLNTPPALPYINQIPLRWNVDQNLIPPAKEGEPSLMRYTVVASVVLAAKPD
jgi:uncharacterized protein YggE